MDVYVPGASVDVFIPNDNDPSVAKGSTNQLLLTDLVSVTVGDPVLAESVEALFAVIPFCTTEKESDAGENDNAGTTITVRVTCNVALA